jgi:hypothetical protein
MKRRKLRKDNTPNPKVFKILFAIAGGIFLLTGILYCVKFALSTFSSPPAVFANPYLRQNQFIRIDEKLQEKGIIVESKSLSPNKTLLTVKVEKGPEVLFTSDHDIDWQISSLHSIIYKLTIENKQPKQIDFRFGKPIVKF